jgi:capsular exopolysaccharide synthesis family protein
VSNIFDALRRSGDEIAGVPLPGLLDGDQPAAQQQASGAMAHGAAAAPAASPAATHSAPETSYNGGYAGLGFRLDAVRMEAITLRGDGPILAFEDQRKTLDQYRMLRTRIQQHRVNPRLLLIAGAGPGDGKTTTAINLAAVLSMKSHTNVVLVDADFRRSSIRKTLGLSAGPGIVDVLTGQCSIEQAVVRTEQYPNLYILGNSEPLDNSAELLDSPRWKITLDALRKEFSYVVLDSPPIGSLADYDLLQASADGVVLVMRPDHTHRNVAMRALDSIPKDKFLGVVMNSVEQWFLKADPYSYSQEYYASPEGAGKK